MHVHLALPGLLWPARTLPDVIFDLDFRRELPAAGWLLGRARRHTAPPASFEAWLARRFGHGDECADEPPLAALRLLGEEDAGESDGPGAADWLCADPAHLDLEQGQPMLADPARLDLAPAEIAEIAAVLTPILATAGEFHLHGCGRGYLRLAAATGLHAAPPSSAVGRAGGGMATLLPGGRDATRWIRLANEAQIALHALELNRRREATGKPVVNTLWFWGAGRLAPRPATAGNPAHAKIGDGDTATPLVRGLARHAGTAMLTADAAVPKHGTALLVDERLLPPRQQLDVGAWRTALRALEQERLAPLLADLRRHRLRRLTLTAPGDEHTLELDATPTVTWQFWRRPRTPIETLAP